MVCGMVLVMRLERMTGGLRSDIPRALAIAVLLTGCGGDAKAVGPDVSRINLSLDQVIFTQVAQDERGSLALVAGAPASAKVTIVRTVETVDEVAVVLRLFRGGVLVHTDTARTGGVLGPSRSLQNASAEFLVPGALVAADVSWQVALDPRQRSTDSTRADNVLPALLPAPLHIVELRPIRIRLVPVILTAHGDVSGDVTAVSAEAYVRFARQLFPSRAFAVTVGAPVRSAAFAGAPPVGGDRGFWWNVLGDVDRARAADRAGDELWYGVVTRPDGYERFKYGGFAYIPTDPLSTQTGTRTAAGLGVTSAGSVRGAQYLVAHELGHLLGRSHAPGCGAPAPIDSLYPGGLGSIAGLGHDVWSWSAGVARHASSVGADATDVMSYCQPSTIWIGPYTHGNLIRWRAVDGMVTRQAAIVGPPVALP